MVDNTFTMAGSKACCSLMILFAALSEPHRFPTYVQYHFSKARWSETASRFLIRNGLAQASRNARAMLGALDCWGGLDDRCISTLILWGIALAALALGRNSSNEYHPYSKNTCCGVGSWFAQALRATLFFRSYLGSSLRKLEFTGDRFWKLVNRVASWQNKMKRNIIDGSSN